MRTMSWVVPVALLVGSRSVRCVTDASADPAKAQITVLYDAFGETSLGRAGLRLSAGASGTSLRPLDLTVIVKWV